MIVTAAQHLEDVRRPRIPPGATHLVFPTPKLYPAKPHVFPSLKALAGHIHRRRDGAGIELEDAPLLVQRETVERFGVSVWTQVAGERARYLGWYFLGGAGRRALEAALDAAEPRAQLAEVA